MEIKESDLMKIVEVVMESEGWDNLFKGLEDKGIIVIEKSV